LKQVYAICVLHRGCSAHLLLLLLVCYLLLLLLLLAGPLCTQGGVLPGAYV
jgi:hypothetical protein